MAVTLAQSALLSANDLQRGVVETIIESSPVLSRLPFLEIQGNAYAYDTEATLPGVEFRAVNSAYTESTGTVSQVTESLVILGGDADVDRFIVQTRGNLNDQRAVQTRMKSKSEAYKFNDAFINGDTAVDANSFDGLKKRLTGAQVIAAGTNGLAVIGADDAARHAFLDQLDAAIANTANPQVIFANANILGKLRSSARRLGYWQRDRNEFGQIIDFYNGLPLVDMGTKADGTTLILPQTETQGASSVASSIYVVGFSESEGSVGVGGLQNGGIDVRDLGELETKSVFRTRIEWFVGLAVFGGKAATRLSGVLNS